MDLSIFLARADYSPPIFHTRPQNTINPIFNEQHISSDYLELLENLEMYYAPNKINDFNKMTRNDVYLYLMKIYNDEMFCDIFAGCIKKDYTGQFGTQVPTPHMGKKWYKKQTKKC